MYIFGLPQYAPPRIHAYKEISGCCVDQLQRIMPSDIMNDLSTLRTPALICIHLKPTLKPSEKLSLSCTRIRHLNSLLPYPHSHHSYDPPLVRITLSLELCKKPLRRPRTVKILASHPAAFGEATVAVRIGGLRGDRLPD